jgi:protein TonB
MALGPFVVFNKSLTRAQSISLALHGTLIAVLLIPGLAPPPGPLKIRDTWLVFSGLSDLTPWKAEAGKGKQNRGGGGGGERNIHPARHGGIPPFTRWQITPPSRPQPHATLLVPPTLVGPNLTPPSSKRPIGDPNSKSFLDSLGPGSRGGVGDGDRGGVGDNEGPGRGPGEDGWQGGPGRIAVAGRDGAGTPICAYCPNPQFTEEAIRVKYVGAVTLRLVVTAEGLPTNVSVIRGVGYGLDEAAREKVRTWRFTPARDRNGRPIATWVLVEVRFQQF